MSVISEYNPVPNKSHRKGFFSNIFIVSENLPFKQQIIRTKLPAIILVARCD